MKRFNRYVLTLRLILRHAPPRPVFRDCRRRERWRRRRGRSIIPFPLFRANTHSVKTQPANRYYPLNRHTHTLPPPRADKTTRTDVDDDEQLIGRKTRDQTEGVRIRAHRRHPVQSVRRFYTGQSAPVASPRNTVDVVVVTPLCVERFEKRKNNDVVVQRLRIL